MSSKALSPHARMIDEEFHGLCPPLSDEEYQQLEANIVAEGCRDHFVVWAEERLLLDGHNRDQICQTHAVAFDIALLSLPSRDEAINWIIDNQLGRRNLTPEQRSSLRGQRYQQEKNREGRPPKPSHDDQVSGATHQRLAEAYHVAPKTIQRDEQFATAVDTLEEQVRAVHCCS